MTEESCELIDPRIRRTRRLLQQALEKLLEHKDFAKISVQDIADRATLNRATFYDHYADKFELLECMVGSRFYELLAERGVQTSEDCQVQLRSLVLGLCDYLRQLQGSSSESLPPHMESAIISVLERILLDGLKKHRPASPVSLEMIAAAVSWAIFGAAKEWVLTRDGGRSEEIAETLAGLVAPMLHGSGA